MKRSALVAAPLTREWWGWAQRNGHAPFYHVGTQKKALSPIRVDEILVMRREPKEAKDKPRVVQVVGVWCFIEKSKLNPGSEI